jgi:hypothetical protein
MDNWKGKLFLLDPCHEAKICFSHEDIVPEKMWHALYRGDWLLWLCFNFFPERSENLVIRLLKTHITTPEILAVLPDVIVGREIVDLFQYFYSIAAPINSNEIVAVKSYEIYVHKGFWGRLTNDMDYLCGHNVLADYVRQEFSFEEVFEALNTLV